MNSFRFPGRTFVLLVALLPLSAAAQPVAPWTPAQLDQLLAPIALYPDPLLALILTAATEPSDVVLADRALAAGDDAGQIGAPSAQDSVGALAHYPAIVGWMAQNIEWTTQVGEAYLNQPRDVEDSIQRLRSRARAAGALVDTPQQRIVIDNGNIEIEPVANNLIYVPLYNPALVFGAPGYSVGGPLVTFGEGYPAGPWLSYQFDWERHGVWIRRGLREGPRGEDHASEMHPWRPDADRSWAPGAGGSQPGPVRRSEAGPRGTFPPPDARRWQPATGRRPGPPEMGRPRPMEAHPAGPARRPIAPGRYQERREAPRGCYRGPSSQQARPAPARPPPSGDRDRDRDHNHPN